MGAPYLMSVDAAGGVLRVRVAGELDMAVGPVLREHVINGLDDPRVTAVVIDLWRATFIDSAGIGALVRASRSAEACGKALHVEGAHGAVARVLDMTGLTSSLVHDGVPAPGQRSSSDS